MSYLRAREQIIYWIEKAPTSNYTETLLTGLKEGCMRYPDLKLLQLLCKTIGINAIIVNVYTCGDITPTCEKFPEFNGVLKRLYTELEYTEVPTIAMGEIYYGESATSAFHLFHADELRLIEAQYEVLQSY